MPAVSYNCDGTPDKPLGKTAVTTEQEFDFLIAAGSPAHQKVQMYTDADVYLTKTAGGTATPNNCELVPAGSWRNFDVWGIQGNTLANGGGVAIYLLSLSGTANVRFSQLQQNFMG